MEAKETRIDYYMFLYCRKNNNPVLIGSYFFKC